MVKEGVPANINPFSIITDRDICDGSLEMEAPGYFSNINSEGGNCDTYAPSEIEKLALSQKQAEDLVRNLSNADVVRSLAVKEPYAHIIPADLKNLIPVSKGLNDTCLEIETYFLE